MVRNLSFYLTTLALFFFSIGHLTSPAFLRYFNVLLILPMLFFSFKNFPDFKRNKSILFLILFTSVAFISLCLNYSILEIPHKSFENLRYYLLGFLGISPLVYWLKRTNDKTKYIFFSLYCVSIIVSSLRALYLFLQHGERTGGYLHPMTFGYGLAMIIPFLIWGLLHRKKISPWFNAKLCLVSLPFAFLGLALTQARGAVLGLALGLPFVTRKFFPRLTKTYVLIAGLGLALISINYFYPLNLGFKSRMFMSYDNGSDSVRRTLWKTAWIATEERPVLGWGLQNYYTQLERILREHDLTTYNQKFTHAHNMFLEISSGTGIIGILLFSSWLFFWIKETLNSSQILKSFFVPFFVVILISGQFEFFITETNGRLIFLLYALSKAIEANRHSCE